MNVLVLTPDRVGSTLLQRYLTLIMNSHNYDKPVVNLHEITNGLELYYSEKYQREMVGKPKRRDEQGNLQWGYYQTCDEIIHMLDSTDHYKTSRLALYHLYNRLNHTHKIRDRLEDQLKLYDYLNNNFYLIAAKRHNLFEYGLSWIIQMHSNKLNVFTHKEKGLAFNKLMEEGIVVELKVLRQYLNTYLEYEEWLDRHFNVNINYNYEKDSADLDAFCAKLNIYPNAEKPHTFETSMGMDFKTWNACHYLFSDTSGISKQSQLLLENKTEVPLLEPPKQVAQAENTSWMTREADLTLRAERTDLSVAHSNFLKTHLVEYNNIHKRMWNMRDQRTLVNPIPIKLNTMMEKASMIKNYRECFDTYNAWCEKYGQHDRMLDYQQLKDNVLDELNFWYNNN